MSARLPSMHALKAFESAARLKSFKAAADELHVSPTAISHQIRDLEQTLGTCLFERGFRTVILTHDGQKLADVCTRWMSELKHTIAEIKTFSKTITISTTNAFAAMWLVPNLSDFKRLYPQIDVVIKADDTLVDIKNDMRFDLAIRYGNVDQENEYIAMLTRDCMGLFATQQYWDRVNTQESVDVYLTRWKNKSLSSPEYENVLQHVLTNNLAKLHYFEDENQVIQTALSHQAVAVVSKYLVQHYVMQGWLVEKYSDQVNLDSQLSYYLISPKRSLKNNAVQYFQAWIKRKF